MTIETFSYNPHYVAIAVVTIVLSVLLLSPKHEQTPPGPRRWPLIGNIFDLPMKESWKVYLDWSRKYIHGAKLFILNSAESIQGLFTKHSNTYSDRIFHQEFETNSTVANRAHELHVARRLLQHLLTSPNHAKELRLATGDTILLVTYGITPKTLQDPFIRTPKEVMVIFADVSCGGYLVDIFPFLRFIPKWFPGAAFQHTAEKGRPLACDLVMALYEHVKTQMENGMAVPSVASRFLSAMQDGEDISDQEIETICNVDMLGKCSHM
ncbi:cytochrome P450 [Armillaria nabsnona]|nr:cytochrome P450 [Armillaria nabsnona]